MRREEYKVSVFINCPYDQQYTPIFEAIVFAIHDSGFRAKCASERLDSSELRLSRIRDLIAKAQYSIHDLSRTDLDNALLPRFNMPLELGIDLGCKSFSPGHADKSVLIFDSERYRFQRFISDLGGQDVHDHENEPKRALTRVRDWLRAESGRSEIPGGGIMYDRYVAFRRDLPAICAALKLDVNELTFVDFVYAIAFWLDWAAPG